MKASREGRGGGGGMEENENRTHGHGQQCGDCWGKEGVRGLDDHGKKIQ